jgi:hypothetical protein
MAVITANDEWRRMWREAAKDYFNALSTHLCGRCEEK